MVLNNDYPNFYIKTYDEHYSVQGGDVDRAHVESVLLNFIHMQDLVNRSVQDMAKIMGELLYCRQGDSAVKDTNHFNEANLCDDGKIVSYRSILKKEKARIKQHIAVGNSLIGQNTRLLESIYAEDGDKSTDKTLTAHNMFLPVSKDSKVDEEGTKLTEAPTQKESRNSIIKEQLDTLSKFRLDEQDTESYTDAKVGVENDFKYKNEKLFFHKYRRSSMKKDTQSYGIKDEQYTNKNQNDAGRKILGVEGKV